MMIALLICDLGHAVTLTYSYDSLNRLTHVDYGNGTTIDYTYDPAGNRLTQVVVIPADLAITKVDSADPILEGQNVTYTITATNNGPSEATDVLVTDTLPVGVTFDSAASTQGSCNEAAGTVTCSFGTLANGANANVTIVVTAPTPGLISNTATISGNVTDSVPANNSATQDTTVLADTDHDGLSDAEEALLGTNPGVPDSDFDGLDDWEEVNPGADGYVTNPLSDDSDGDGLTDDLEAVFGSNPNAKDSDSGGTSDFVEYHRNPQTDPWNPADDLLPGSASNDFDGDDKSDILWLNAASGLSYLYVMNGNVIASEGVIDVVSDPDWQVVGTGDYDGNNTADILWRNDLTGENRIYFMDGNTIVSQGSILTVGDTDWQVAGSGDYNGDGKSDILWRHIGAGTGTGQNHIWFMDGLTIASQSTVNFVSTDWEIKGSGDLNGDGKSDILWRRTSDGRNHVYLMNGNLIASQGTINTVPLNWVIAGTGDYNGDGKSDILWRNTSNGRAHMYLMNGFAIASQGTVGTVPLAWEIRGDGDYNGDGKADILWRNMTPGDGRNYMYFMAGNIIASSGYVNAVSNFDWVIVDLR